MATLGGGAQGGIAATNDPATLFAVEAFAPFLAVMPDAAVVVGPEGAIVAANAQVGTMFGYAPDELIGAQIEALVPERFRHAHRVHRTEFTAAPQTRPMGAALELTGRRLDGTELPIDVSLASLGAGHAVATIRDISERRESLAAQAQLAAIVQSSGDAILSLSLVWTLVVGDAGPSHQPAGSRGRIG